MNLKKRRLQGSFTIEASVIVPLLIFLLAFALRIAIQQYGEIRELSQTGTALQELDPVEILWNAAEEE